MASINQIKVTIGGAEVTPGTGVALEHVIPLRAVPDLDRTIEAQVDPAILGTNMDAASYQVADSIEGGIPLTPRPSGGMGMLIKSNLAQEATPLQVGALVRFQYTGASASNKVVAETTGDTITSYIGALGSEALDSAFGATGVIDCNDVAYDTVDELVAAIDGYTDYSCEKVFEETADYNIGTNKVVSFANKQGKNTYVYIWFLSSTSAAYLHEFTYDPSATAEHPTYTIQKDGFQDNFLYSGNVVNEMTYSAALKGMAEAEASVLGFTELTGQTASVLTLEDVDPLIFYKGSTNLGGTDYTFIRNVSTTVTLNHNADGYGQGSISRQYHQKGKCDITGDLTLRLDSASILERNKMLNNTPLSLSYYFTGKNFTNVSVPEIMLFELPYCYVTEFTFPENAGVLDAAISYRAVNPKGTVYNKPITISMLTIDSGIY